MNSTLVIKSISLVRHALFASGLYMGRPDDLMPPACNRCANASHGMATLPQLRERLLVKCGIAATTTELDILNPSGLVQ